jgi:hypothetical protein
VNGFFTRKNADEIHIEGGQSQVELPVPTYGFDSGINEIILEASDDVTIATMRLHDTNVHDARVK